MRRYKALIIGISYKKSNASSSSNTWEELDGPVQDAKRMESFVTKKLHYGEVVAITDETDSMEVSRHNILAKLNWLVEGAKEGDILFLHYSGHGWQRPTRRRTEEDGRDETIVPADCPCPAKRRDGTIPECHIDCSCAPNDPLCWKQAYHGMIRDNEMRDILVTPLVKGVRLVTLFDSCHSGSILDVRYHYLPCGAVRPMLSSKGLTTIPPELRYLAKPQSRPQSRLEKIRDLLHTESPPLTLGGALGKSTEMIFRHGIPSGTLPMFDDYTIPPELRYLAKPQSRPQSRLEKIQDLLHTESPPPTLEEALGKSTEMIFGHGIPSGTLRMFDDHMHAMRNESQRGVAISLSACIDHDAVFELAGSRGMLTTAFLKTMKAHKRQVRADVLIDEMYLLFHSEWEKNWSDTLKHSPYPVLCSNQLLDLSSTFLI